jgi:hypothetical protein
MGAALRASAFFQASKSDKRNLLLTSPTIIETRVKCDGRHRHQIYVHGNPPPPDHPHWIRRYIADLEKKEELRAKGGLRPFFRRIQSSTFENIEYAGAEYVDTIRATLDEATAEAMLTGSLAQVRSSRAARAFSEANLIKVPYDPQRTIYLSLWGGVFRGMPAIARS